MIAKAENRGKKRKSKKGHKSDGPGTGNQEESKHGNNPHLQDHLDSDEEGQDEDEDYESQGER